MSDPWDLTPAQRLQFREAHAEEKRKQLAGRETGRMDDFAKDIAARARWARDRNNDQPKAAWSTGERLAVALVLGNVAAINSMGYDRDEAVERLAGDIGGTEADAEAWIEMTRAAVTATREDHR